MFTVPDTVEECDIRVAKSWEHFKEVKANYVELREHFLDLLIREVEAKKDTKSKKKAQELRDIRKNEHSRDSYKKI